MWWEEREREKAAVVFLGRLGKIRTRRTNGLTKVAKVGDIQSRGHVLHERTPRAGRWSSHDSVLFFFVPFCPTLPPSSLLPFFFSYTSRHHHRVLLSLSLFLSLSSRHVSTLFSIPLSLRLSQSFSPSSPFSRLFFSRLRRVRTVTVASKRVPRPRVSRECRPPADSQWTRLERASRPRLIAGTLELPAPRQHFSDTFDSRNFLRPRCFHLQVPRDVLKFGEREFGVCISLRYKGYEASMAAAGMIGRYGVVRTDTRPTVRFVL